MYVKNVLVRSKKVKEIKQVGGWVKSTLGYNFVLEKYEFSTLYKNVEKLCFFYLHSQQNLPVYARCN